MSAWIEFIDEALEKIEDAKNVNAITTARSSVDNKLILCAHMADGEQIRLSKGQGRMTFPFEPLVELCQVMGRSYFKNFKDVDVNMPNNVCVNINNFKSFNFSKQEEDSKFVDIAASFHNGQEVHLFGFREKYFNKKGKDNLIQIENEIRDYQLQNGIISEEVETPISEDNGMDM